MKILMTSHYTLPHRGGIETVIEKLSRTLAERGHEIRILSSKIDGQTDFDLPTRRVIGVPAFDPLKNSGVHYPLFSPALIPLLWREARWAEIVHVQGMLYLNSVLALLFARLLRRPAVLTEHAGYVQYSRPLFNFIQRIAVHTLGRLSLALSQIVIVPDVIVQDILEKEFGVSAAKIRRVPFGVDTALFHPISEQEKQRLRAELGWDERPKVLFVGNYVARKRISLLVQAASDRFDLVLCGEGYETARLPSFVRVYPPQNHERLARLYQAADLFVVPSSVETFAIVAYEAMACGLPVIMTEDLSHLTIRESQLVRFCPPQPDALCRTIHELLDSPQERQRLGLASAAWVQQYFSWHECIVHHEIVYSLLLKRPTKTDEA